MTIKQKGNIVFFRLSSDLFEHLNTALSEDYNIVIIKDKQSLASFEVGTPVAIFAGVQALEWPLDAWVEKLKFFSGGAEVFIAGSDKAFTPDQRKQLRESEKKGDSHFFTNEMILHDSFYYPLFTAYSMMEAARKIASLQNMLSQDVDLQQELDLRSRALEREKEFTGNIINSITSGLIIIDTDGSIVMLNNEAARILKIRLDDYLSVHFKHAFSDDIVEIIDGFNNRAVKEKKAVSGETLTVRGKYISWKCYPVYKPGGSLIGILHFVEDITEEKHTEEQLMQAEKLATIGTMLSGIAHEMRNPLSIISARVQRLLGKKENYDDWSLRYMDSINEQVIRCGDIVNNLLKLSRKEAAGYDNYCMNDILEDVLQYINYQDVLDKIEVIKDYSDNVIVYCDRSQMVQVFINLISNAIDAMEKQGTLTLKLQKENGQAYISVTDTGPGIDPRDLAKIFDPFFTTKEAGKGTGLGLPIVYRIIQQHSGRLKFNSKKGKTVFEVILPIRKKRSKYES